MGAGSSPIIYYNNNCLRCKKVDREMISVGAIIFCKRCYPMLFNSENPVTEERKKYRAWLEISKIESGINVGCYDNNNP